MTPDFKYTPSDATDIAATWRRHGWKPTTQAERRARRKGHGITVRVIEAPELRPDHVTPFALKLRAGGRR